MQLLADNLSSLAAINITDDTATITDDGEQEKRFEAAVQRKRNLELEEYKREKSNSILAKITAIQDLL